MNVVEQTYAQVAGKARRDKLERGHAPADDALLSPQIVGTRAIRSLANRFGFIGFAADALEQGIDFILREEIGAHSSSLNDERGEQDFLDWPVPLLSLAAGIKYTVDLVLDLLREGLLAFLGDQIRSLLA